MAEWDTGYPLITSLAKADDFLVRQASANLVKRVNTQNLAVQLAAVISPAVVNLVPSGDTTGVTDQAAVSGALTTLGSGGGTVNLGTGNWYFNAPVTRPGGVIIQGALPAFDDGAGGFGTVINASSTWAKGAASQPALLIHSGTGGGFRNLCLQGTGLFTAGYSWPGSPAHGISCNNDVGSFVEGVLVNNVPGNGLDLGTTNGSWMVIDTACQACSNDGAGVPVDSVFLDYQGTGNSGNGMSAVNPINSKVTGSKFEWNSKAGLAISGDNGATGGFQVDGCSFDRNTQGAVSVSGTGNWPVKLTGSNMRREASNGTSAAVTVAASTTMPVVIDGLTIFPGFDDGGGGNQGPVTGISIGSGATYVSVSAALVHAVTTPVSGTITAVSNVAVRTGTWSSPGSVTLLPNTGGTDTSGAAAASSPSFTSGTAKQLSTTQDVILYIAVQTSAALSVAIGPTSTPATTLMPSQSYALGLNAVRVPKGWWVKITGTIADLTITAVTCLPKSAYQPCAR